MYAHRFTIARRTDEGHEIVIHEGSQLPDGAAGLHRGRTEARARTMAEEWAEREPGEVFVVLAPEGHVCFEARAG